MGKMRRVTACTMLGRGLVGQLEQVEQRLGGRRWVERGGFNDDQRASGLRPWPSIICRGMLGPLSSPPPPPPYVGPRGLADSTRAGSARPALAPWRPFRSFFFRSPPFPAGCEATQDRGGGGGQRGHGGWTRTELTRRPRRVLVGGERGWEEWSELSGTHEKWQAGEK